MAKKKQLAGKSTKLAKLPLTQALARRAEEQLRERALPADTSISPPHEGRAHGPLAAAYLYLLQELTALHRQLTPGSNPPSPHHSLPYHLLGAPEIKRALTLARQGLHELQHLLSQA
ncbi:MAG: hypothetical protein FJ126_06630 [Deltaproteobacteria bacterium]|nr:hypothetical protein [Deltaproteobacteria bacterium]